MFDLRWPLKVKGQGQTLKVKIQKNFEVEYLKNGTR